MQPFEFLSVLRRRWAFVVLGLVVGLLAGWITAPGAGTRPVAYQAETTLLRSPTSTGASINLEQAALLVTTGEVPDLAVVQLDDGTTRSQAVGAVSAKADQPTASLTVTATASTPERAEQLSGAFADALVASYAAVDEAAYEAELARAADDVETATKELDDAELTLVGLDEDDPERPRAESQVAVAEEMLDQATRAYTALEAGGPPEPAMTVIERGTASTVTTKGVRAPDSKPQRAALLGMFGLAVGVAGAFAVDKFDTRIRGKEEAEAAFGVEVIAEIPPLPGGRKAKSELLAVTQPSSPFTESYRTLRTVLLYAAATAQHRGEAGVDASAREQGAAQHAEHAGQVVLVTSPTAGEGKTTTAAHLAALLAEVGKKVLVVSADFRRPRIHELLGAEREPGLADVLTNQSTMALKDLPTRSAVPGVRLLASGRPVTNPAPFLRETAQLIASARKMFDYVVIDTAPLLVANDATELAGVADFVVVTSRARRTTQDAARRAMEVLHRVEAPVLGVVLIGATDTPAAYRYYTYRYYSDDADDQGRDANRGRGERSEQPTRTGRRAQTGERDGRPAMIAPSALALSFED